MWSKLTGRMIYEAKIKTASMLEEVPISAFVVWDELSLHEQLVCNMTAKFVRDELMVTVPLEKLPNLDIESAEGSHPDGDANKSILRGKAALEKIQQKAHWDKDKR